MNALDRPMLALVDMTQLAVVNQHFHVGSHAMLPLVPASQLTLVRQVYSVSSSSANHHVRHTAHVGSLRMSEGANPVSVVQLSFVGEYFEVRSSPALTIVLSRSSLTSTTTMIRTAIPH